MYCESKLVALKADNMLLKAQIMASSKKRMEACRNAESLAEDNYHLEKELRKAHAEIEKLIIENERLLIDHYYKVMVENEK